MIILSFDPGLEKTGYAIIETNQKFSSGFKLIRSGLIKTNKKSLKTDRFTQIYNHCLKIINQFQPQIIILEEIFFFKNKKTIIDVAQSQGIIYLLAGLKNIKIYSFTPLKIKQVVTGYGLSDKKAIKKMINLYLNPDKKNIGDDEYDAIACGLAYCFQNQKLVE